MKKLLFFALNISISILANSQTNFIPLRINSQYLWSISYGLEGEVFEIEELSGYSYDSEGRLIQLRHPYLRENYSYDADTVYWVNEEINFPNGWKPFYKSKRVYHNEKIQSELYEKEFAGTWDNTQLYTYFYNSSGLETLYYHQHWGIGEWEDFNKGESEYYEFGNLTQKLEYSTYGTLDTFKFFQGIQYGYDSMNRKIEEISLIPSSIGIFAKEKKNWVYGVDDLLDTFNFSLSSSPGIWDNFIRSTYSYSEQLDTTIQKSYNWSNNSWKYLGKRLYYKGPNIYDDSPDSTHYYSYNSDLMTHTLSRGSYYNYIELGNNKVYYKFASYTYSPSTDKWELSILSEKWYSLQGEVGTKNSPNTQHSINLYPNPCSTGQALNLSILDNAMPNLEAQIFDLHGRLIAKSTILNNSSQILAPKSKGCYSVVVTNEGNILGISKLIVD